MKTNLELADAIYMLISPWNDEACGVIPVSLDTLRDIRDRLRRLDELENRPDPLARLERWMSSNDLSSCTIYRTSDDFSVMLDAVTVKHRRAHNATAIEAALTQALDQAEK